jgi:hypothetical protein
LLRARAQDRADRAALDQSRVRNRQSLLQAEEAERSARAGADQESARNRDLQARIRQLEERTRALERQLEQMERRLNQETRPEPGRTRRNQPAPEQREPQSTQTRALEERRADAVVHLAEARAIYSPANPKIRQAEELIRLLDQSISRRAGDAARP